MTKIVFNIFNSTVKVYNESIENNNDENTIFSEPSLENEGIGNENNDTNVQQTSSNSNNNAHIDMSNVQQTSSNNNNNSNIDLSNLLNLNNLGLDTTLIGAVTRPIQITNNLNDSSGTITNNLQEAVGELIQNVLNIPSASLQVEVLDGNSNNLQTSVHSLHNGSTLSIIDEQHVQDENNSCAICHSQFQNSDIIRTINSCSHFFHANCIEQWFQSHNNCPVCRGTL
tara:strand:+ start:286 stop:966 length:681 start_codon:yes stop_codon:yes gene_type:complete